MVLTNYEPLNAAFFMLKTAFTEFTFQHKKTE